MLPAQGGRHGYPAKRGAAVIVRGDKLLQCSFLFGRTVADQTDIGGFARLRSGDESETFECRCSRQDDTCPSSEHSAQLAA